MARRKPDDHSCHRPVLNDYLVQQWQPQRQRQLIIIIFLYVLALALALSPLGAGFNSISDLNKLVI